MARHLSSPPSRKLAPFFALMIASYVFIALAFGFLFYFSPNSVANIGPGDLFSNFAFSVQTFATIGYGYFYPQSTMAHVLVTIESAVGLLFSAVITGLLFAKFARPEARVVFSKFVLWTKQNGKDILTLRLGNLRTNRVFEGQARFTLLSDEITSEGHKNRRLLDLKLMRSQTPLFFLSWTLIHFIDEESPLFGLSPEQMRDQNMELFVTFIGLDQDLGQTIVANAGFTAGQVIKAKKFVDMTTVEGRSRHIDFSKIDQVEL